MLVIINISKEIIDEKKLLDTFMKYINESSDECSESGPDKIHPKTPKMTPFWPHFWVRNGGNLRNSI